MLISSNQAVGILRLLPKGVEGRAGFLLVIGFRFSVFGDKDLSNFKRAELNPSYRKPITENRKP
jgi:hypothetical protein